MLTILIVEDEALVSFGLEQLLFSELGVEAIAADSVKSAKAAIARSWPDFVFLDVNVLDGTTFDLARWLRHNGVPFAFTSALNPDDVPEDLRSEKFVRKPCRSETILSVAREGCARSGCRPAPNNTAASQKHR